MSSYVTTTTAVTTRYPLIVPGGRFVESYYWDSYWIVRGLLVCDMTVTAWQVISNLLSYVETFSFVPNGGRIYYLDRSQPPMLTEMVSEYLTHIGWESNEGLEILETVLPILAKEYQFWMTETNHHLVTIDDVYNLNVYYSNGTTPRPESYKEDLQTCNGLLLPNAQAMCYRNIRTGAETGWDFSSRWLSGAMEDMNNIQSIDTTNIVPIDLNAILYRVEMTLAAMSNVLATYSRTVDEDGRVLLALSTDTYLEAAHERFEAIDALLWDETSSRWLDYNISNGMKINAQTGNAAAQSSISAESGDAKYSTIASWIPMWAGIASLSGIHREIKHQRTQKNDLYDGSKIQHNRLTDIFASVLAKVTTGGMAAVLQSASSENPRISSSSSSGSGDSSSVLSVSMALASQLVASLEDSGLIQVAGILTSTLNTGQ